MSTPRITIITPTTPDRAEMLDRLRIMVAAQNYPRFEHLIESGTESIGHKLNVMCAEATGSIIVRMDDDDKYAPNYIPNMVAGLMMYNCDMVGLSSIYYHHLAQNAIYEYTNPPKAQLYLCGATLAFKRTTWEANPFPRISKGEETAWQGNINRAALPFKDSFLATLHGNNTCSHNSLHAMKKLTPTASALIIKKWSGY